MLMTSGRWRPEAAAHGNAVILEGVDDVALEKPCLNMMPGKSVRGSLTLSSNEAILQTYT